MSSSDLGMDFLVSQFRTTTTVSRPEGLQLQQPQILLLVFTGGA
ncbi:unnamed protein product [Rhodiola kirilowii]